MTMPMSRGEGSAGPTIDVVEFIDSQPVGGFQIRLLLTCAAVLFLDGFDTQAMGYVAPALAREWGLSKAALGLGGAMPNVIAMTSEFNPQRRRATMVMIMFCGFSVGAALGGLLAAGLIPQYSWRAVFVVGGVAPVIMVPILALKLPESVRFLALHGNAPAR